MLSEVDGQAGHLIIRGRSLDDLAGQATFEDLVALLFTGFFEDLPTELPAALGAALSARFSVDVRHDTDPPFGFEDTDTATRVSLVYAFGE